MTTVRYSFIKSLPVMAGYIVLGAGFGVLLVTNGYNAIWAFFMSVFIYAGSMQYVSVDLLAGGASLITAALMTLVINARHLFYGISMADKYKGSKGKKTYLIFSLTDETYSIVCDGKIPENIDPHKFYFLLSLMNQCYWVAGSVAGAIIGKFIKFNSAGIEFSMTALFIVVFINQWRENKNHIPALIGVIVSVICLIIFGSSNFIIPSMILIVVALTILKKIQERRNTENE